jgi:hypothetical protein
VARLNSELQTMRNIRGLSGGVIGAIPQYPFDRDKFLCAAQNGADH